MMSSQIEISTHCRLGVKDFREMRPEVGFFNEGAFNYKLREKDLLKNNLISTFRLSQLSLNPKSHLRVKELFLMALDIDANPSELLDFVCDGIKLPKEE